MNMDEATWYHEFSDFQTLFCQINRNKPQKGVLNLSFQASSVYVNAVQSSHLARSN